MTPCAMYEHAEETIDDDAFGELQILSADPEVHVERIRAVESLGATIVVLMNISGADPLAAIDVYAQKRPPGPARGAERESRGRRALPQRAGAPRRRRLPRALIADDATWHSPVGPPQRGRDGFRQAIEEAYAGTRWFVTDTLSVRDDAHSVVARVRNRGERDGESLDSVQRLVFRLTDGLISDVRIHVDDPSGGLGVLERRIRVGRRLGARLY